MGTKILFYIQGEQSSRHEARELDLSQILKIGRVEDNDLVLDDPKVSRSHIQMEFLDGKFLVRDLNSKFGTWFKGEKMTSSFHLREDEVIKIGDTNLSFKVDVPTKNIADLPESEQKRMALLRHQSETERLIKGLKSLPDSLNKGQNQSLISQPSSHYNFYLEDDIGRFEKRVSIRNQEDMEGFYRRILLFPFFLLFVVFVLFPTMSSFLVALTYSGIAIYFSRNLLPAPSKKNSFALPITMKISNLQERIQKKIESLPSFDQEMLSRMQSEMQQFVAERLPQMEKDIFSLNRTLVSGTRRNLEQKIKVLEHELKQKPDEGIHKQIEKNMERINRQMKMQKNIKNLLMHLILKLEDYQTQLEILESTLIAQEFRDQHTDFAHRFLDLQNDIDDVYREYNSLKLEHSAEFLQSTSAEPEQLRKTSTDNLQLPPDLNFQPAPEKASAEEKP